MLDHRHPDDWVAEAAAQTAAVEEEPVDRVLVAADGLMAGSTTYGEVAEVLRMLGNSCGGRGQRREI